VTVAAGAPGQDPGTSAAPPRAWPRVLVIDDEPAMLRALHINLRVREYDVATSAMTTQAPAGASGVLLVGHPQQVPDLVVDVAHAAQRDLVRGLPGPG